MKSWIALCVILVAATCSQASTCDGSAVLFTASVRPDALDIALFESNITTIFSIALERAVVVHTAPVNASASTMQFVFLEPPQRITPLCNYSSWNYYTAAQLNFLMQNLPVPWPWVLLGFLDLTWNCTVDVSVMAYPIPPTPPVSVEFVGTMVYGGNLATLTAALNQWFPSATINVVQGIMGNTMTISFLGSNSWVMTRIFATLTAEQQLRMFNLTNVAPSTSLGIYVNNEDVAVPPADELFTFNFDQSVDPLAFVSALAGALGVDPLWDLIVTGFSDSSVTLKLRRGTATDASVAVMRAVQASYVGPAPSSGANKALYALVAIPVVALIGAAAYYSLRRSRRQSYDEKALMQ